VRRRLTLALVGLATAALLLAGMGTYALARVDARERTRSDVAELATALTSLVREASQSQNLARLARAFDLEGVVVVRVQDGRLMNDPPPGVTLDDLADPRLRTGEVVTGSHGRLVFAMQATRLRQGSAVIVVTKELVLVPPEAVRWWLVSGAATVLIALVVGIAVARGLTKRLRDAETVARRIAAGDLSARATSVDGDDEVAQLARSVNEMATELERSRDIERHFLLTVSHDLRTPLTSIRGYAEAIADGAAPDTGRAAEVIVSESKRLERLVADLLELAKLDARQLSLHAVRCDVGEIAADIASAFGPAAAEAGVRIESAIAGPAVAEVDPDRLGQALANLVENALKHTSTVIRVGVGSSDGTVTVTVTDDGAGIAADDLPRIFDPLYVGRRTPRRQVGSGLGLAIVRQLVTAMGGTVAAGDEPTGGARLEIRLPSSTSSVTP